MAEPRHSWDAPHGPRLETERLIVATATREHAVAVADYYVRNTLHFAPYSPRRPAGYHDVAAWRGRLDEMDRARRSDAALHLFGFERARNDEHVVAHIAFTSVSRGVFQACFLGYGIDAKRVGQGLMREGLAAAIRYAFDTMMIHRIMANYVPTNERSGRLLRSLGFTVEGYARDYLELDGVWKDHILTSLTNDTGARPRPS